MYFVDVDRQRYLKEHRGLIYDLACTCVSQNMFEEAKEKYFEFLDEDDLLQVKNGINGHEYLIRYFNS